jgi:hypothetical protein
MRNPLSNKQQHLRLGAMSVLACAALVACGGGSSSVPGPSPVPGPSTGTLKVSLTDAPACGFDAVNVTVNKVRVHQSSDAAEGTSGWSDITLSPARKINLLNLTNGVLDPLGTTTLPTGRYNQIRLVLDANTGTGLANSVVPTGSTEERSLETPSALQSGIKLNGQFDVVAGEQAEIVLDFDACKSVLTRGNGKYALKPVIKLLPSTANGITGFVSTAQLGAGVAVSAQQGGVIISATVPDPSTGEFFLARLAPGNYDVVLTGANSATSVIATVPVATSSSKTVLSTAAAPLTLAPGVTGSIGGVATLTPASTTEAAFIAAKQSFAAGQTVTVKFQGADLASGAYTIAGLPTTAPQYALYSATLPLVFVADPASTPGTGKYRVDASATGYTSVSQAQVDISTNNATDVNFSLVP